MRESKIPDFSERLAAQAEARKALLEKFKPKPAVQAVQAEGAFETREQRKARELAEVRARRAAERKPPASPRRRPRRRRAWPARTIRSCSCS
jgi:hypothetical protein